MSRIDANKVEANAAIKAAAAGMSHAGG